MHDGLSSPQHAPPSADVVIIGSGAAGLATAIFTAQTAQQRGMATPRICLLDGARKVGAKILVAGGGRCNVTHVRATEADYQGSPHFVRNILRAFGTDDAVAWFASMGVVLKQEETGKLFPVTDDGKTVLNALLLRMRALGVQLYQQHRVTAVESVTAPDGGPHSFLITHSHGTMHASHVVMATGGKSLPKSGSDGVGWDIVKHLGHTVTATYPALVPLVLQSGFIHTELSGVSLPVELSTWIHDAAKGTVRRRDQRTGEILWTHIGISGPVAMDASRFWIIARAQREKPELRCNFFPGDDFATVDAWVLKQTSANPKRSIGRCLAERLPRNVAKSLLDYCSIDVATDMGQLSRDKRRQLVHALTALVLPVVDDRGWNHAEVTAGGVPLEEVNFRTMASMRVPGLYLAGEILDCEGRIGGFNFQWAWATGYVAGTAIARAMT